MESKPPQIHHFTGTKTGFCIAAVKDSFRLLTTTLLSLLLPLSFLLLARLATAGYFISLSENSPIPHPAFFLPSIFLHATKPTILHILISLITASALTHALTGKTPFPTQQPLKRHRIYAAWIFLLVLQICVGLGIEGSIAAGIDGSVFGQEKSLLCRVVFFLGLHETTLFWWRTVVKPVVDDTVSGGYEVQDGWAVKVAIGLSFGGLWWWRLRDEVEALVVVPEVKRDLMVGIGMADFVGWWMYCVTGTIGVVRIGRGVVWVGRVLAYRSTREEVDPTMNDEKV